MSITDRHVVWSFILPTRAMKNPLETNQRLVANLISCKSEIFGVTGPQGYQWRQTHQISLTFDQSANILKIFDHHFYLSINLSKSSLFSTKGNLEIEDWTFLYKESFKLSNRPLISVLTVILPFTPIIRADCTFAYNFQIVVQKGSSFYHDKELSNDAKNLTVSFGVGDSITVKCVDGYVS